jgi:diguanylate cyclase (GGDEF)-like protein
MLNVIEIFFEHNLDAVYFVYGLAFFAMGVAIFVRPRQKTKFALADILWLLAWFGVLHGINEWADALVLLKGRAWFIDIFRLSMLFASYVFLFEFGRQLFCLNTQKYPRWLKRYTPILSWPIAGIISFIICIFSVFSHDAWQTGAMLVRHFLGFPGCVLIAAGFLLYYKCEEESLSGLRVKRYFVTAAASFLAYGILAGLIVSRGHYFPSTIINIDSFRDSVGIPVQVFRGACAIIAGWSTIGLLTIFNIEALRRLEEEVDRRKRTESEREELNRRLMKVNETLNKLALEDAHTGLYNYRYLLEIIESEFVRARRDSQSLSVIMLDIDYFKSINDVYGHGFGDLVLRQFAQILKDTVRRYDIVTRYGGEEFVIISPAIALQPAKALACRLLDTINLGEFGNDSTKIKVKVSMAVVSYPADQALKGTDLIERADRILSRVKEQGGNRVYSSQDAGQCRSDFGESENENMETAVLKEKLEKLTRRANQRVIEEVAAFARTIEAKNHYTGAHVEKTVEYSLGIAAALGLSNKETENIRQGAIIHDLGKIGINMNILNKPSKLSAEEYERVKAHPQIAIDIIRPIHSLRDIVPLVYHHHERWDGKGYPLGLKGPEIPVGARVIAVADVYQALISDRPYRKAYSREDAIGIIQNGMGTQFDPHIAAAFLRIARNAM